MGTLQRVALLLLLGGPKRNWLALPFPDSLMFSVSSYYIVNNFKYFQI